MFFRKEKLIPNQYIVTVSKKRRKLFINSMISSYKLKPKDDMEYMLNSKFPFVIDFNLKIIWVLDSITCLACASMNHQIISEKEFKSRSIL